MNWMQLPIDALEQVTDAIAEHFARERRQKRAASEITIRVSRSAAHSAELVSRLLRWAEAYAEVTGSGTALDLDITDARRFVAAQRGSK